MKIIWNPENPIEPSLVLPGIVQGLWIGKRLSLMEQLSIQSFLAHGHAYHLYVYDEVRDIPPGTTVRDGNEILPGSKIFKYKRGWGAGSYSAFSNPFRFKLILERGGYWVDSDLICLKAFDFVTPYVFSSEHSPEGGTAANLGVLRAPQGCSFLQRCYEESQRKDPRAVSFRDNGARVFLPLLKKFDLEVFVRPAEFFCPVPWWDFGKLIDPGFDFEPGASTYAVHLWHMFWQEAEVERRKNFLRFWRQPCRRHRLDKNCFYEPTSLYGRLQKMYLDSAVSV